MLKYILQLHLPYSLVPSMQQDVQTKNKWHKVAQERCLERKYLYLSLWYLFTFLEKTTSGGCQEAITRQKLKGVRCLSNAFRVYFLRRSSDVFLRCFVTRRSHISPESFNGSQCCHHSLNVPVAWYSIYWVLCRNTYSPSSRLSLNVGLWAH